MTPKRADDFFFKFAAGNAKREFAPARETVLSDEQRQQIREQNEVIVTRYLRSWFERESAQQQET